MLLRWLTHRHCAFRVLAPYLCGVGPVSCDNPHPLVDFVGDVFRRAAIEEGESVFFAGVLYAFSGFE